MGATGLVGNNHPCPSIEPMGAPTLDDIVRALVRGPATPDALAARLGGEVDRETMWWAVEEGVRRGIVASTAALAQCGPDGLCGTSSPTILTLVPAARG